MFEQVIDGDGEFELRGERFHIDLTPGRNRRPSDARAFTLVKNKAFLDLYAGLAKEFNPESILELGIFQGGSFVLLDKLFHPQRMSAVDISPVPIAPLEAYIERTPGRFAHFRTSQDDATALHRIVDQDLAGKLDLVVDDASHLYELTKRSFEILFPRLSPGGVYIIEDWAWSHDARNQPSTAPLAGRPALTNLVFELVTLLGSTRGIIADISIHRPFIAITKGSQETTDYWSKLALRGREMKMI